MITHLELLLLLHGELGNLWDLSLGFVGRGGCYNLLTSTAKRIKLLCTVKPQSLALNGGGHRTK